MKFRKYKLLVQNKSFFMVINNFAAIIRNCWSIKRLAIRARIPFHFAKQWRSLVQWSTIPHWHMCTVNFTYQNKIFSLKHPHKCTIRKDLSSKRKHLSFVTWHFRWLRYWANWKKTTFKTTLWFIVCLIILFCYHSKEILGLSVSWNGKLWAK